MGSLKKKTTEKFKESKKGVKYEENVENDSKQDADSEGEEEAMPKVEGNSKFGRPRKKSSRYSYYRISGIWRLNWAYCRAFHTNS